MFLRFLFHYDRIDGNGQTLMLMLSSVIFVDVYFERREREKEKKERMKERNEQKMTV